ncbi:MAG: hypothetical protein HGB36_04810 [Chlorobiaceae bacterium]|jgi:hypothetical protein|nr:hypothetical protein [Chlorobiaceae bacterium]
MAIKFKTFSEGDILYVTASGVDESLEDVQKYAMGVLEACLESGIKRVLCDETGIDYQLGTFDLYELGKFFSINVPAVIMVAIVCRPTAHSDTGFFENVVVNRGHRLKLFRDNESAKRWLIGS